VQEENGTATRRGAVVQPAFTAPPTVGIWHGHPAAPPLARPALFVGSPQVVQSAEQGISHVYCYVDRVYELDSIQVQARFRRMFTNCNRADEFVDSVHVSW
jgi:hypothetical protein